MLAVKRSRNIVVQRHPGESGGEVKLGSVYPIGGILSTRVTRGRDMRNVDLRSQYYCSLYVLSVCAVFAKLEIWANNNEDLEAAKTELGKLMGPLQTRQNRRALSPASVTRRGITRKQCDFTSRRHLTRRVQSTPKSYGIAAQIH